MIQFVRIAKNTGRLLKIIKKMFTLWNITEKDYGRSTSGSVPVFRNSKDAEALCRIWNYANELRPGCEYEVIEIIIKVKKDATPTYLRRDSRKKTSGKGNKAGIKRHARERQRIFGNSRRDEKAQGKEKAD
jgi:hypothetical protein